MESRFPEYQKDQAKRRLFKTFCRFKLATQSPLQDLMDALSAGYAEHASNMATQMFGTPTTLLIDPKAFEGLQQQLGKKNDK
jgi:hypothetical protein